jgi:hypothetical protein
MYFYLVEYNNNIIGVYEDFDKANTFILSCLQNNFMKNFANILCFRANSCYYESVIKITLDQKEPLKQSFKATNSFIKEFEPIIVENKKEPLKQSFEPDILKDKVITEETNTITNEQIEKIAKQKIEIQHNINLLKLKKEQLKESKQVYENDIKLFKLFQENKNKDPNFVIPELFEAKYKILEKLNNDNKLSWDNFYLEYKTDNDYDGYFVSNDYENNFTEPPKNTMNNFEEELDIETDSNTEESY